MTSRVLLALALGLVGCLSARSAQEKREEPTIGNTEVVIEEAKIAAQAYLSQRAQEAASGETFAFARSTVKGSEILLEYRAEHPDWYVRTHSLLTVAFDTGTREVRLVSRR